MGHGWVSNSVRYPCPGCSNSQIGPIGEQFRVDYANVMTPTTNWLVLTNITLPYSPYVVVDYNSAGKPKRFYRAGPVP